MVSSSMVATMALTVATLISRAHGHPAPEPGSGLADVVGAFGTTFLKPEFEKLFGKPLNCCDGDNSCKGFEGQSATGRKFQVCYHPGDAPFLDIDAAAVKCNINLHFTQDTYCIGIPGSVCEYSGGIMRGKMSYLIEPFQISAEDSATLQAGVDDLLARGSSIDYSNGRGFDVCALFDNEAGCAPSINYVGHQGDEC